MEYREKVVVIGGGSGSYTVLRGLKSYPLDITAVVTMFDSGGSSGKLRTEFGILPPGDVRRCLLALSTGENEELFQQLFSFRFQEDSSLQGHNFGNLFLMALSQMLGGAGAIRRASDLLKINGKVLPVSLDRADVCVELEDGQNIIGETNIDIPKHNGDLQIKRAYLVPQARIHEEVFEEIIMADYIVIGPGDLYTSLIPNLLVGGMSDALKASRAKKIVTLNLMTKWGETNNFTARTFLEEILRYSELSSVDYVIANTKSIPASYLAQYAREKKYPMALDIESGSDIAHSVITADVSHENDHLRHDSTVLGKIIDDIIVSERAQTFVTSLLGS
jgi:uncharacterized cofD-like protein